MSPLMLPALPGECEWQNQPVDWKVGEGNELTLTAGKSTDWFFDPAGGPARDTAPAALFRPPDANYLLSARVELH
jgi:hypothetical protein